MTRQTSRYRRALGITMLASVAALALPVATGADAADQKEVAIAYIGALTGDYKTIVAPGYQAAQLAFDNANAGQYGPMPVKITLNGMDTQGTSDQAVTVAASVVGDDSYVGIIGPAFSNETQAAGPRLDQAGIPFLTPSATNPGLSQNGWSHWFRAVSSDAFGGPIIAKYIGQLHPNCVFVAGDGTTGNTSWDVSVSTTLTQMGVKVMPRENFTSGQKDFSALVSKVAASECTAFFIAGYSSDVGPIRKQMTDAGLSKVVLYGTSAFKDDQFLSTAGSAADGTLIVCDCSDVNSSSDEGAKAFVAAYQARWKEAPGVYAAEAWDIAQLYVAALKAGKTSRDDINAFFHGVSGFKGVTKTYKFQENGELDPSAVLDYFFVVKDNKWTLVGPAKG
jgi:branched-chain amino acid transport system substrate-binding protein